jgi:hypothetical protein
MGPAMLLQVMANRAQCQIIGSACGKRFPHVPASHSPPTPVPRRSRLRWCAASTHPPVSAR